MAERGWPGGKRLLLMRHGETYTPGLDTPMASPEEDPELPLTERGRARLAELARELADHPLDAAYASPYRRSRESAEIVCAPHGLAVRTQPGLEELAIHPPAGGTLRDIARRYLEMARDLEAHGPENVWLDDGRTVADRLAVALEAVRKALEEGGERVLVVAHGGINRFLLAHWLGLPPARFLAIDQDFGCVNVIDFVGSGHAWVRGVNLTVHDPFKLDGRVS